MKLGSRWPLFFSGILVILFAAYFYNTHCIYPANKRSFILITGILSAVSVVYLSLYVLRRNSYRYRVGTRQGWLQAHVYTGIISTVLVCVHINFRPTGTFSILLSVLFLLVIASGIVGSLLYTSIPLSLTKFGRIVKSEEEIVGAIENCLNEADTLASSSSETYAAWYREKVRPLLESRQTRWSCLITDESELLNRRSDMIDTFIHKLPGQDMHALDTLRNILTEREKLSFMQARLNVQNAWLTFHLPLTLTMLTAALIHAVSIGYY